MSATAALLLQQERDRQDTIARISSWLFDQLQAPVPAGLDVRFRYPKCPFCKRRPELTVVKGQELLIESRPGSPAVKIPRYRVLPCCSASYKVKHEEPSKLAQRRAREHDRGRI